MFGVAQGAAKCLGWGALHDHTMIFLALPDYRQNLLKVHLTSQWVEAIRAAIKTVHSAGILHNDLNLRNFVGNSPNSVKLIDFACSATSGFSSDTMARQEEQFTTFLVVQVSFASYSLQSFSTSLALSVLRYVLLSNICVLHLTAVKFYCTACIMNETRMCATGIAKLAPCVHVVLKSLPSSPYVL